MLIEGTISNLILLSIFSVITIYLYIQAEKGQMRIIRRLPALTAIEEAIGRAIELGRPVHANASDHYKGGLGTQYAPAQIAGLTVVQYVARKCAQLGARLFCMVSNSDMLPVYLDSVRTAYIAEGKADDIEKMTDVYYIGGKDAYIAHAQGILRRERPAANIMVGSHWGGFMQPLETCSDIGCQSIAGSIHHYAIPYMACMASYIVIGEEVFAAHGYLSQDPKAVSGITSGDFYRVIISVILIFGIILKSLGIDLVTNLLNM